MHTCDFRLVASHLTGNLPLIIRLNSAMIPYNVALDNFFFIFPLCKTAMMVSCMHARWERDNYFPLKEGKNTSQENSYAKNPEKQNMWNKLKWQEATTDDCNWNWSFQ